MLALMHVMAVLLVTFVNRLLPFTATINDYYVIRSCKLKILPYRYTFLSFTSCRHRDISDLVKKRYKLYTQETDINDIFSRHMLHLETLRNLIRHF
jgi:hypothetical protein